MTIDLATCLALLSSFLAGLEEAFWVLLTPPNCKPQSSRENLPSPAWAMVATPDTSNVSANIFRYFIPAIPLS